MRFVAVCVVLMTLGFGLSHGAVVPAGDSSGVSRVDFVGLKEPATPNLIKIPRQLAESDWEEVSPADSIAIAYYQKLRDRLTKSASRRSSTGTVFLTIGAGLLVTGSIIAWQGYESYREWERHCDDRNYSSDYYDCYGQNNWIDVQKFFAGVSLIGGAAFVGSGLGFKSSGASRLRLAKFYDSRVRYWEDLSQQSSSATELHWMPICDLLHRRVGSLVALSF